MLKLGALEEHAVRQLPAHDAVLRPGARGLQGRPRPRRPARRQPSSSCSAITTPASRATGLHAKDIGIGADEISWTLNDRVPLFIRVPTSALRASAFAPRATADKPVGKPEHVPDPLWPTRPDRHARRAGWPDRLRTDAAGAARHRCRAAAVRRPQPARRRPTRRSCGRTATGWTRITSFSRTARMPGATTFVGELTWPPVECGEADRSARRARQISRLVVAEDLQQRLLDRMQAR